MYSDWEGKEGCGAEQGEGGTGREQAGVHISILRRFNMHEVSSVGGKGWLLHGEGRDG